MVDTLMLIVQYIHTCQCFVSWYTCLLTFPLNCPVTLLQHASSAASSKKSWSNQISNKFHGKPQSGKSIDLPRKTKYQMQWWHPFKPIRIACLVHTPKSFLASVLISWLCGPLIMQRGISSTGLPASFLWAHELYIVMTSQLLLPTVESFAAISQLATGMDWKQDWAALSSLGSREKSMRISN